MRFLAKFWYLRSRLLGSLKVAFMQSNSALLLLLMSGFAGFIDIPFQSTQAAEVNFPAHYELSMSQNDGLCKPIVDFYNRHIMDTDDDIAGFVDDRLLVRSDRLFPATAQALLDR